MKKIWCCEIFDAVEMRNTLKIQCGMLIKVNSLIYKTKIDVTVKSKIKITYVLILSIFLVSGTIEQEN